ncbi:MAG: glycosyltransferase, partial [Dissulfurispiraceae bacterium]
MLPAWSVKASIVIPCYNHGQYLREALESALRSDFDGYEVIVVDDGSTDEDTLSIIEELKSQLNRRQNVTFLRQENQGLAAARNNGIMAARGEYILPLDADNRIRPNYLRKAIEILDNDPSIGVVYAYAKYIGEKNGFWEFPAFDARKLLLGNFVEACSVLRKSVWEDCNGYDPDMGIMGYEDWDLWIGAMERGWKFHLIKEALFDYRIVKGSMIAGCNVTENRRHLIKYICNKHRDTYVKNLGYVVAEKDVSVLEVGVLVSNLEKHAGNLEVALRHRDARVSDLETHSRNLEEVLRQKDTHIDNLEVALRHRDTRVSDLETHSSNLEEVLRQRDTHIGNIEEVLRQRDTHIGSLEEVLRHRDSRIGDLETHSRNLQEVLRQRDTHIGNIEEVLRQRDTHIGSLEEVLRHRDSRIGDLETHSRNLQEVLRQRDTHIGSLEEVLRHRDSRIGDLETHSRNLQETLRQRDTHIGSLEEVLRQRDSRIGDLETHSRNLQETLRQRDAHIADLEEMLRQRDTHIGNLEVALQHRDARISDLETHSNNLAEVLRQRDTHIGNLEVTLQHRDTHIRNLEEVVQYRGARIGDLETHARNMEEVVRQRDETLHAIYTSHGWRLLSLYYRIRDRLLPANSARRKVIKYIWNLPKRNRDGKAPLLTAHNVKRGIFYLRKWELKTFIQKVREKMRSDTVACSSRPQTPALHLPMQPEDVIIPFQDVTVSVIIPTKNAGGEFELLMSVLSQQKGFKDLEIVVVDSGSSDGTLEIARSYGAKVVEIPSEKFSHSYARNLGAEHAIGNHLLFTVQDALPPSATWLYELAGKMKHTGVAALSCSETPREDVDMLYRVLSCNHMRFLEIDNGDRILSKPEKEDCVSLRKNGQLSDVACLIR